MDLAHFTTSGGTGFSRSCSGSVLSLSLAKEFFASDSDRDQGYNDRVRTYSETPTVLRSPQRFPLPVQNRIKQGIVPSLSNPFVLPKMPLLPHPCFLHHLRRRCIVCRTVGKDTMQFQ